MFRITIDALRPKERPDFPVWKLMARGKVELSRARVVDEELLLVDAYDYRLSANLDEDGIWTTFFEGYTATGRTSDQAGHRTVLEIEFEHEGFASRRKADIEVSDLTLSFDDEREVVLLRKLRGNSDDGRSVDL